MASVAALSAVAFEAKSSVELVEAFGIGLFVVEKIMAPYVELPQLALLQSPLA